MIRIGLFLTLVFLVLSIGGVIDWAWYWLISPLLISLSLNGILVFLLGLHIFSVVRNHKRRMEY